MDVRRRRRWLVRLGVISVLLSVAVAPGPGYAATDPPPPIVTEPSTVDGIDRGRITLITGDTVTVTRTGNGSYSARAEGHRSHGSPPVIFQQLTTPDGDLYVLPSDAGALVGAGKLDLELFNIKRLVEDGRADADTDVLPVIVQLNVPAGRVGAVAASAVATAADALPASVAVRPLESISAAGVRLAKDELGMFWSTVAGAQPGPAAPGPAGGIATRALGGGVAKIWLDRKVKANLDTSVAQIGAPAAWQAGFDGTGVTVAVLDTGYAAEHPDLAGQVTASQTFIVGETVQDGNGHGTHVATTIAGTGAASGGKYKGVAPGAKLIIGKVLSNGGYGDDSGIIDGMEWAAANGARVVNMSLGGDADDGTGPMSQAADRLTASTGTLFVVAAGNDGPGARTVSSPGSAASALTVGAVDKQDQIAGFSSRGPLYRSYRLKPDVTAPGVDIVAGRVKGTPTGDKNPVDDFYHRISGTSMATPHVAGAAALLAQQHQDWRADQLKGALTGSAKPHPDLSPYTQGAGRIDVAKALDQRLIATPSTVDFGRVDDGSGPATRVIALTNHGAEPLAVNLSAAVTDGVGRPADVVSVAPATATVPAGGSVDLTVTFRPAATSATFTGVLRATDQDGTELLRAVIGVNQAPPGHNLRLRPIPPAGWPNPRVLEWGVWTIMRVDQPQEPIVVSRSMPHTDVFLPDGVYAVAALLPHPDPRTGDSTYTWLTDPEVVLRGADKEVVIDGTQAKPVEVETPRPTETYGTHHALVRGTAYGPGAFVLEIAAGANGREGRSRIQVMPAKPVTVGAVRGVSGFALADPLVQMRVVGRGDISLRPFYLAYHWQQPKLDLDRRVGLVDAGSGGEEEIAKAGVHGKLALVSVSSTMVNIAGTQARVVLQRLRDAGALAVVLFDSAAGVPRWCAARSWDNLPVTCPQEIALPAIRIGPGEAADLRALAAAGPVTIAMIARPRVSYQYNLRFHDPRGIATTTHRVRADQLAAVTQRYHASEPMDLVLGEISIDPAGIVLGAGGVFVDGPASVTEYFGPVSKDVAWLKAVRALRMSQRDAVRPQPRRESVWWVFAKPEVRQEDWLTPATFGTPRHSAERFPGELSRAAPSLWCVFCRDTTRMTISLRESVGGGTHVGDFARDRETHLYRDGQEVASYGNVGMQFDLRNYPGPARYRYTIHVKRPWMSPYPGEVLSTWDFTSQAPTGDDAVPRFWCVGQNSGPPDQRRCRAERVLMPGYEFGAVLALDNTARAPGIARLPLSIYTQPGAPAPDIAGVRVQVSYDRGAHWLPALVLRKGNGEYQVLYVHPPSAGTTVSLKTEAWDKAGNRVEQVILDAYGLNRRW